jgi:hypothetical protein
MRAIQSLCTRDRAGHQQAILKRLLLARFYGLWANMQEREEEQWRDRLLNLPLIQRFQDDDMTLQRLPRLASPALWEEVSVKALSPEPAESPIAATVAELRELSSPLSQVRLENLVGMLRDPSETVLFLGAQLAWSDLLLTQLHCVRNLNLHAGQRVEVGAALLSDVGLAVLDSIIDIFAAWYSDSTHLSRAPEQILNTIAERFDLLLAVGRARSTIRTDG